jgi:hypothetical protein
MVTNQILLLSVIVSALFLGTFSLSHDSANADIDFCYDQVGDGHIVLRRRDNVRLLVEMTTRQKALAMAKANLIS